MTGDVQRELAEALGHLAMRGGYGLGALASERLATDLLPTVQALIADAEKRAAAQALRDLASDLGRCEDAPTDAALEGLDFTLRTLRYRSAALDPSGAAEGAGR